MLQLSKNSNYSVVPRTQQKSGYRRPVFGPSLLAGHEAALRLDEVLGGGEVLVRSEEVVRLHGRRYED